MSAPRLLSHGRYRVRLAPLAGALAIEHDERGTVVYFDDLRQWDRFVELVESGVDERVACATLVDDALAKAGTS